MCVCTPRSAHVASPEAVAKATARGVTTKPVAIPNADSKMLINTVGYTFKLVGLVAKTNYDVATSESTFAAFASGSIKYTANLIMDRPGHNPSLVKIRLSEAFCDALPDDLFGHVELPVKVNGLTVDMWKIKADPTLGVMKDACGLMFSCESIESLAATRIVGDL
jgi:hypothetical protein